MLLEVELPLQLLEVFSDFFIGPSSSSFFFNFKMTCFLIQLIPVLIFASPAPVPGRLFCEFGLLTFLHITRQNRSLVGAFARIVAIHSRSSPPRTNAINFPSNSLSRASSFTFSTYKLNSPHSAIMRMTPLSELAVVARLIHAAAAAEAASHFRTPASQRSHV